MHLWQIICATFGDAEPFELLTGHPMNAVFYLWVFYLWKLKKSLQEHTYSFIVNICLCQVIKAALCFVVSSREWCMLQDCILLRNYYCTRVCMQLEGGGYFNLTWPFVKDIDIEEAVAVI